MVKSTNMNTLLLKIIMICLGGSLGALSRYSISVGADNLFKGDFHWATFIVNGLGCFLVGIAIWFIVSMKLPIAYELFFITGFLGSFTTFSTYMLDIIDLYKNGKYTFAITYFLIHNLLGITMVLAGIGFISFLFKRVHH